MSSTQSGLLGGTILLALVVAAAIALKVLRRRSMSGRPDASRDGGFGMQDLESLRKSGMLTDEEFSRIRRKAMAAKIGSEAGKGSRPEKGQGNVAKENLDSRLTEPPKDVDLERSREAQPPPPDEEDS